MSYFSYYITTVGVVTAQWLSNVLYLEKYSQMCMTGTYMHACVQKIEVTVVRCVHIIYRTQHVSDTGIKLQSTADTACRIPHAVYETDSSTHIVPADLLWLSMAIRNDDVITIYYATMCPAYKCVNYSVMGMALSLLLSRIRRSNLRAEKPSPSPFLGILLKLFCLRGAGMPRNHSYGGGVLIST